MKALALLTILIFSFNGYAQYEPCMDSNFSRLTYITHKKEKSKLTLTLKVKRPREVRIKQKKTSSEVEVFLEGTYLSYGDFLEDNFSIKEELGVTTIKVKGSKSVKYVIRRATITFFFYL